MGQCWSSLRLFGGPSSSPGEDQSWMEGGGRGPKSSLGGDDVGCFRGRFGIGAATARARSRFGLSAKAPKPRRSGTFEGVTLVEEAATPAVEDPPQPWNPSSTDPRKQERIASSGPSELRWASLASASAPKSAEPPMVASQKLRLPGLFGFARRKRYQPTSLTGDSHELDDFRIRPRPRFSMQQQQQQQQQLPPIIRPKQQQQQGQRYSQLPPSTLDPARLEAGRTLPNFFHRRSYRQQQQQQHNANSFASPSASASNSPRHLRRQQQHQRHHQRRQQQQIVLCLSGHRNGGDCCNRHSRDSVTSLESAGRNSSCADLEWEIDESMRPCCSLHAGPDLLDNASVSTAATHNRANGQSQRDCPSTTVDDNFRSIASSQASIPALDWDEQGETEDLVSLSNLPLDAEDVAVAAAASGCCGHGNDLETEKLINEIEQLTSRALQETNQWNQAAVESSEVVTATDTAAADEDELVNNNVWPAVENNGV